MNVDKFEANEELMAMVKHLSRNYEMNKKLPDGKETLQVGLLFHKRDGKHDKGFDVESYAVARGITVGMDLMKEIIEGRHIK